MINAQLMKMTFTKAIGDDIATHKLGNQLDQVFAKNITISNAVINDEYDHSITDHKSFMVTFKPKSALNQRSALAKQNVNMKLNDHT